MISRRLQGSVERAFERQAAVVLIGPRQVGKITLAFSIAEKMDYVYLDLEDRADREKLSDPALYLGLTVYSEASDRLGDSDSKTKRNH